LLEEFSCAVGEGNFATVSLPQGSDHIVNGVFCVVRSK